MEKMKPRIKSLNDLFDSGETEPYESAVIPAVNVDGKNQIKYIAPSKIRAFKNHPFRLYDGERLDDLIASIKENGILAPTIVRKIEKDENGYRIKPCGGLVLIVDFGENRRHYVVRMYIHNVEVSVRIRL